MSVFSEAKTVQDWLVTKLAGQGWTEVDANALDRDVTDVFIESEVVAALIRLNSEIAADELLVDEVVPQLRIAAMADDLLTANERMTSWLKGHKTIRYTGTDRYSGVSLVDFEDLDSNTYWVSREVTYGPVGNKHRFDVVLWVNGFPLVVIETKTPVKASVSWLNGAMDIANTYVPRVPEFFSPNLMLAATEGKEFHYGAILSEPSGWQMWGSTEDPYDLDGMARVVRTVELLLTPPMITELLGSFTYFHSDESARFKILPRYPQVEAARAIYRKVKTGGTKGLIWHFQGTGKTLLMAFAANLILEDHEIGDPTILIVLDRIDLVGQTMRQFQGLGAPNLMEATTRTELHEALTTERTGVIVTTIFRFTEGHGALTQRDNVIVLVDEAHRTQEGDLGGYMREALPNARFFGLTGTPISDKDRNTFELFGDPQDPGHALSEYSMERSIHDGASVPVHVEPRLVNWHLDTETMDAEFDALVEAEGLSEDERDKLVRRAGQARTIVRNPDRIAAVCADILEHFASKVAPLGLKAQVVAFDRELVVAYEAELNRLIAANPDYDFTTKVVMTTGSKDDPAEWKSTYGMSRPELDQAVKEFKTAETGPHLLIVTAKLLTGFDAPIEGAMYLDKPLSRHTLFQAITRTNRRYKSPVTGHDKRYGLIVDYIGLGSAIAVALRKADPEGPGTRPVDIDGLITEFSGRKAAALARFAGIERDGSYESLFEARQVLTKDEGELDEFARQFIGLQAIWEVISPHEDLEPHESDYLWLAGIYETTRPTSTSDALLWARLGAKTQAIVHRNMRDVTVKGQPEQVVIDAESIDVLRTLFDGTEDEIDPTRDINTDPITVEEVFDTISRRIKRRLETTGAALYKDLSEQLERLHKQAVNSAEDSLLFLKQALEVAQRATKIDRLVDEGKIDEAERILDPNIGALTQIVEECKPEGASVVIEDVVTEIDRIVRDSAYSGWATDQAGDREVRKQLRLALKKFGLPPSGELFDRAYAYVRENY
ncbi:HsdR family type I site-specific deoxyribonuclease [Dietzia sp. DQ11-44]|uniref:type I restriction endonuclease subunit R n=1 Tax=Dietzia sp. DQ11-44 TaxID=1630637 RepID=UPI0015F94946|nr:type I restriction endonuclease subunit R [Dietzia sp. DQ11-44]